MSETVVYFVRHSEPVSKNNFSYIEYNEDFQIRNEKSFLSLKGIKKAEELSKKEEMNNIDAVYSSNYVRALQTSMYFASSNNTIINIDERFNERTIGDLDKLEAGVDFEMKQQHDFDYKLPKGESLNQTKKRMADGLKQVLMNEAGNRVVIVSHSTAIISLLSTWCDIGYNVDDNIILTYNDNTIVDGNFTAPMVFKLTFDGMNLLNVEYLNELV